MRVFAKPIGIERLSLEARVLYTGFAVFTLLGMGSSVWLYADDGLGVSAEGARRYYLGEASGPTMDLPADLPSQELRLEKPARQVVETFHFHLFSVPVYLLVIAHLFMMTSLGTRAKSWIIALSSLATLLHLVTPPLVRFVTPGFAMLMFPSALAMALSFLYMTARPIWEMWVPQPPAIDADADG